MENRTYYPYSMRTRLDITLGGLLLILDGLICFLTLGW